MWVDLPLQWWFKNFCYMLALSDKRENMVVSLASLCGGISAWPDMFIDIWIMWNTDLSFVDQCELKPCVDLVVDTTANKVATLLQYLVSSVKVLHVNMTRCQRCLLAYFLWSKKFFDTVVCKVEEDSSLLKCDAVFWVSTFPPWRWSHYSHLKHQELLAQQQHNITSQEDLNLQ